MTMCERWPCSSNSSKSCCLSTLCCATRHFTSFEGTYKQFAQEIKSCGDAVIVFFYRPICAPCAAIRSKIIDVADNLSGGTLKRKNSATKSKNNNTLQKSTLQKSNISSNKSNDIGTIQTTANQQHKQKVNANSAAFKQQHKLQKQQHQSAQQPKPEKEQMQNSTLNSSIAQTVDNTESCHGVNSTPNSNSSDHSPSRNNQANSSHMVMSDEDLATCHQVQANVDKQFAKALQNVKFLTVDTNRNELLTALHDVRSLPTFIAYRNGRIIGRVEGAHDNELTQLMQIVKSGETAKKKV